MSDATAAERARRYRARRRERDAGVTLRPTDLGPVLEELRAVRATLAELVAVLNPPVIHSGDNRNVTRRHAVQRDVTERHGGEGAPARTRGEPPPEPLRGSVREGLPGDRDVTPIGFIDPGPDATADHVEAIRRVWAQLAAAHEPPSTGALADALDLPGRVVAGILVGLGGQVERIPATGPGDRDRWRLVAVESPSETIRCADYHGHAQSGHRRDPGTGRFRCYQCEPELVAMEG